MPQTQAMPASDKSMTPLPTLDEIIDKEFAKYRNTQITIMQFLLEKYLAQARAAFPASIRPRRPIPSSIRSGG